MTLLKEMFSGDGLYFTVPQQTFGIVGGKDAWEQILYQYPFLKRGRVVLKNENFEIRLYASIPGVRFVPGNFDQMWFVNRGLLLLPEGTRVPLRQNLGGGD